MRWRLGVLLLAALIGASPVTAAAMTEVEALSPAQVVELGTGHDGSIVLLQGEAIGDVLKAVGGGSWVNVLGEEVGIGIWMTAEMVAQIEHLGHYKHSGDHVVVRGRLNRTCQTHNGEFDVHAHDLTVISRGEPREFVLRLEKGLAGAVGCVVALFLWIRYRALRAAPPV